MKTKNGMKFDFGISRELTCMQILLLVVGV